MGPEKISPYANPNSNRVCESKDDYITGTPNSAGSSPAIAREIRRWRCRIWQ